MTSAVCQFDEVERAVTAVLHVLQCGVAVARIGKCGVAVARIGKCGVAVVRIGKCGVAVAKLLLLLCNVQMIFCRAIEC